MDITPAAISDMVQSKAPVQAQVQVQKKVLDQQEAVLSNILQGVEQSTLSANGTGTNGGKLLAVA